MSEHDYEAFRDRMFRERGARLAQRIPALKTLVSRFGSFPMALYAAGLIGRYEALKRTKKSEYTDEELYDVFIEALLEGGLLLSSNRYDDQRSLERADPNAPLSGLQKPTARTLANRLGNGHWDQARSATLQARPSAAALVFAAYEIEVAA